jgi:acid phosphatase (class A)
MTDRSLAKTALSVIALCFALTTVAIADDPAPMPGSDRAKGYLEPSELPNSVALLPPPPELGSAAENLDQQIARHARTFEGQTRFKLAALDADLSFPYAAGTFSCAIGVAIKQETAPTLYALLRKTMADAGAATGAAKNHYRHARPFMLDGRTTCQPEAEEDLRKNGSYPSGHTSIGWTWAEILAEIAPDRADLVLARGRAFGDSRIVCDAHWASDVMEGRIVGAATVVKLHANAEFRADLAKAKTELDAARTASEPPQRDCAEETLALKQTPWLTP